MVMDTAPSPTGFTNCQTLPSNDVPEKSSEKNPKVTIGEKTRTKKVKIPRRAISNPKKGNRGIDFFLKIIFFISEASIFMWEVIRQRVKGIVPKF